MIFKDSWYFLVLFFILHTLLLFTSCGSDSKSSAQFFTGETMGTTYTIKYFAEDHSATKNGIDSLLKVYNQSVSTYIPNSTISEFNKVDSFLVADNFLLETYYQGVLVSERTKGAFDPTVMPLVNYWGFGYKEKRNSIDSTAIDSIMQFVGYRNIDTKGDVLFKRNPKAQLDLSAVAKGYAVDLVANYLKVSGVEDFMLEIGGEVKTSGEKPNNEQWILGIDKPVENAADRELHAKVLLDNKAMASSGNYRNFRLIDGKKVAHTINSKTGYSEFNELLSVSVITDYCAKADAYATAFMVMGFEETRAFLINNKDLKIEVVLIYADKNNELKVWNTNGVVFQQ